MEHSHSHNAPNLESRDINRSFFIGITLNVVYVVIELWYGYQNNSTSLISDAVHNIGDISGLILAFIAFRLQRLSSNKVFTYGFKKGSVLASFLNSILLAFAIGAIAWQGVLHIMNPSPISGDVIMIVAGIGIIINFSSALLFSKKKKDDLNIKAAYWHLMADALVSLGVVIAGLIIKFTDWYFMDGVVSILIAIVILLSTWSLFKDSLIGIMDGAPTSIDTDEIKQHLLEIDKVNEVHHLHIWSISTNENGLTCHIKIDTLEQIPELKKRIKHELVDHNIKHSTLEFELESEQCEST